MKYLKYSLILVICILGLFSISCTFSPHIVNTTRLENRRITLEVPPADPATFNPESVSLEPLSGEGTDAMTAALQCSTREGSGYTFCPQDGDFGTKDPNQIAGFRIANDAGGNAIVQQPRNPDPGEWEGPWRKFEFRLQGRIRRDIEIHVSDAPSDRGSDQRELLLLLFPRKVMPSIRMTGDRSQLEVTLPTGETVFFDSATHEIQGGAFSEKALSIVNYARDRTLGPGVNYVGSGVAVTIVNRGHDPKLASYALISKSGEKLCKISAAKLWSEDEMLKAIASGDATAMDAVTRPLSFRFPSDETFDVFLKKNCSFGFL